MTSSAAPYHPHPSGAVRLPPSPAGRGKGLAAASGGKGEGEPVGAPRIFSHTARRLSGLAAVLCGWRPEEFWAATPDELAAVVGALTGDQAAEPPAPGLITRLQEAFPDG